MYYKHKKMARRNLLTLRQFTDTTCGARDLEKQAGTSLTEDSDRSDYLTAHLY